MKLVSTAKDKETRKSNKYTYMLADMQCQLDSSCLYTLPTSGQI